MPIKEIKKMPFSKAAGCGARELLNDDIETIIRKKIPYCKLEGFPYARTIRSNVIYHVDRSIREVARRYFSRVNKPYYPTHAFKIFAIKDEEGLYEPYVSFDPVIWEYEIQEAQAECKD